MRKIYQIILLFLAISVIWASCKKEEDDPPTPDPKELVLHENVQVLDTSVFVLIGTPEQRASGIYTFTYTGGTPTVKTGDVIVGAQGIGFLRHVASVTDAGGTVVYQTTQATLEDLFKSGDLSFAIDMANATKVRKKAAMDTTFSYDLYNQNGFVLTASARLKFASEPFFDFAFAAGGIQKVVFEANNTQVLGSVTLSASASQDVSLVDQTDTIATYRVTKVKWVPVGGILVPIVVVINTNFVMQYGASVSAQANASVTVTSDNHLDLSVNYSGGVWSKNFGLEPDFDVTWVPLNGTAGAVITASLTPVVDVKFYGVVGPYISIGLHEEISANVASPSLDWDFTTSAWLKATAGASVTVLGKTLADYNVEVESSKLTFQTPYELKKISGDNQEATALQTLGNPIKVRVLDQNGDKQSNVPVYFNIISGGGSADVSKVLSDADGYAQTFWTIGSSGTQTMEVRAKQADGIDFTSSPQVFSATAIPALTFTDSRDGNVYAIKEFGSQMWMIENMRYNAVGSFYNASYPDTIYGRAYNFDIALNVCPSGWHLPSDDEWKILELYLGLDSSLVEGEIRGSHGLVMKSDIGWSSGGNGTNASGFNAYPAGSYEDEVWYDLENKALFWTSTVDDNSYSWYRRMNNYHDKVEREPYARDAAMSCRCVQD